MVTRVTFGMVMFVKFALFQVIFMRVVIMGVIFDRVNIHNCV